MKKIFTFLALALMSVGVSAEVTVVFSANSLTKEMTVALPHTFMTNYETEAGEFDLIIQELYGLTEGGYGGYVAPMVLGGNGAVVAGYVNDEQFITVNSLFADTVTVNGEYYKYVDMDTEEINFTLAVYIKPAAPTGIDEADANATNPNANANPNATKVIRNGLLLIERNGRFYNVQGAVVK